MVSMLSFMLKIALKFYTKVQILGSPWTGHGMPHCNEGHQLLIKCYITFIRFIRMVERASGSIYKPLMIITVSFLLKITLKFHVKCQSLGTPFEKGNGMVWYRHRHPLLLKCLPHPSWDIYMNDLKSFWYHLQSLPWLTPCHYCQKQPSNFM